VSPTDRDKAGGNDAMANADSGRPLTPYERFVAAAKRVLSVSKEELDKREAAWRKRREKKRREK